MIAKRLVDSAKVVQALAPIVPSSAAPRWVSLKDYQHVSVVINVRNATTVTGSAIALQQATAVAGTGAKTLALASAWRNLDTATAGGDTLAEFTVSSDTFTTDATNSKDLLYVIEFDTAQLDTNGGFDCFRVTAGNGTAATVGITYILSNPRYASQTPPTAITD